MTLTLTKTGKFATYSHPCAAISASKPIASVNINIATIVDNTSKPSQEDVAVDLEQLILNKLQEENEILDTWEYSKVLNIDHQQLIGVVKSLLVDRYVVDEPLSTTYWALTDEGKDVVLNGSPEIQVLRAIPLEGVTVASINASLGEVAKIGVGVCMKNKWIQKKGDMLVVLNQSVVDETAQVLQKIDSNAAILSEEDYKNLKKRKLVLQITRKSYRISKGPEFRVKRVKKVADLLKSMLGNKDEVGQ